MLCIIVIAHGIVYGISPNECMYVCNSACCDPDVLKKTQKKKKREGPKKEGEVILCTLP